jgi:hypothetical protein
MECNMPVTDQEILEAFRHPTSIMGVVDTLAIPKRTLRNRVKRLINRGSLIERPNLRDMRKPLYVAVEKPTEATV